MVELKVAIVALTLFVVQGSSSSSFRESKPDIWFWCSAMTSFTSEQLDLCLKRPAAITAMDVGGEQGIFECKKIFFYDAWNCEEGVNVASNMHYWIGDGSLEDGYLQSIRAAGMALEVARQCGTGQLSGCKCEPTINETVKWLGCEQKMDTAEELVLAFLASETHFNSSRDIELMNKHNTRLGIEMVKRSQRTVCHCEDESSTCHQRVCFNRLPRSLHAVAKKLKARYRRARQAVADGDRLVEVGVQTVIGNQTMAYINDDLNI